VSRRLALLALMLAAHVPAAAATGAAEDERLCLSRKKEEAVLACRQALRLGLPARRASVVRSVLAAELSGLGRGEEALEIYREQAALAPEDPETQLRFGSALFFLVNRPAEAVPVLQTCLRLSPQNALAYGALGTALAALEQHPEAAAAFAEAARLDPDYFEGRPAARQTYEASQQGKRWP
jgi:tetratricopeptide (TPR) repeat protein